MNGLFKLMLAVSSISLLPTIFLIKSRCYLFSIGFQQYIDNKLLIDLLTNISLSGYFLFPVLLFFLIFYFLKSLSKDEIKKGEVIEVENATNTFLPSFLGYFFIALSIPDNDFFILSVICFVLTGFVFLSQINYFNPLFLILRYRFYNLKTKNGLYILLISKSKYKRAKDISCKQVYRINDFTFIEK